LKLCFYNL